MGPVLAAAADEPPWEWLTEVPGLRDFHPAGHMAGYRRAVLRSLRALRSLRPRGPMGLFWIADRDGVVADVQAGRSDTDAMRRWCGSDVLVSLRAQLCGWHALDTGVNGGTDG